MTDKLNRVVFLLLSIILCTCQLEGVTKAPVIVNVKTFGAKGDNKSDDSEAIQNAINYASKINAIVTIPYGIYHVSKIYINVSLQGIGRAIIKNSRRRMTNITSFVSLKRRKKLQLAILFSMDRLIVLGRCLDQSRYLSIIAKI
jgi:hypothetical protein